MNVALEREPITQCNTTAYVATESFATLLDAEQYECCSRDRANYTMRYHDTTACVATANTLPLPRYTA